MSGTEDEIAARARAVAKQHSAGSGTSTFLGDLAAEGRAEGMAKAKKNADARNAARTKAAAAKRPEYKETAQKAKKRLMDRLSSKDAKRWRGGGRRRKKSRKSRRKSKRRKSRKQKKRRKSKRKSRKRKIKRTKRKSRKRRK
mgnify:CR=1 FL=1